MRGRMPFPIPFLPLLVVALIVSLLVQTCVRMFGEGDPDAGFGGERKTESARPAHGGGNWETGGK